MGRPFVRYLVSPTVYACRGCGTHLASPEEILSKHFHAKSGRAYLFHQAVNTATGVTEERMMTTGLHKVAELHCVRCAFVLGWRYEVAYEKSQKYKEGKVLLERACLTSVTSVEEADEELSDSGEDD